MIEIYRVDLGLGLMKSLISLIDSHRSVGFNLNGNLLLMEILRFMREICVVLNIFIFFRTY